MVEGGAPVGSGCQVGVPWNARAGRDIRACGDDRTGAAITISITQPPMAPYAVRWVRLQRMKLARPYSDGATWIPPDRVHAGLNPARVPCSEPVERLSLVSVVLPGITQACAEPGVPACERPDQTLARGDCRRLQGEQGISKRLLGGDDAKPVTL